MAQHTRVPFSSYVPTQSQIAYAGPMSYNPSLHGGIPPSLPFPTLADPSTLPPDPTYYDISVATHKQIASLQAKLDQKLGPEYISQRPGPGGGPKLTYAEGWKIINLANEVFGFNGWSSNICGLTVDYLDAHDEGRRWNCGVSAVVRVTLRDGVYHEDVGYGAADNMKNKGAALEKCKKEAVTDAIKRTLRNFGNLMGNCLYDKQYTQEIVKIKVQPPKFDRAALHRRPEFEEGANERGTDSKAGTSGGTAASTSKSGNMPPPQQQQPRRAPPAQVKPEPGVPNALNSVRQRPHAQPPPNAQPAPTDVAPAPQSVNASTSTLTSAPIPSVPLTHQPSVDPDEASYFNSDDDALFMQLDMESGNPVLEEDRPIEYEGETNEENYGTNVNQDDGQSVLLHPQRSGASSAHCPAPAPETVNTHSAGERGQPQAQVQAQAAPPNQQRAQSNSHTAQQRSQTRPLRPQGGQRMPQQHTSEQQQHRPPIQPNSNQPHRPSKPIQALSGTACHSPPIGGFHFPPGVDPSSRPPIGFPAVPGPRPQQIVGLKRNANSMSSGGGQLMPHTNQGLAANNGNGGNKPRVPFASLEVGEGGDVKRVRR